MATIGPNEALVDERDQLGSKQQSPRGGSDSELGRSSSGENLIIHNNLRNSNSVDIALQMDASHGEGFEAGASPEEIKVSHTLIDFTPAEYITLLFTDLGVLTPAAVSDELIRLYQ